jgi:hypothetical protein
MFLEESSWSLYDVDFDLWLYDVDLVRESEYNQ